MRKHLKRSVAAAIVTALTSMALVFGVAPVASAHTPAPRYQATSETACAQSTDLGRRVCYDKSAGKVFIYNSDAFQAGPSTSYSASGAGGCSPFRSTAGEFQGDGWVIPGNCGAFDLFITSSGPGSNTIATLGSTAVRTLGNNAAYEFVLTN